MPRLTAGQVSRANHPLAAAQEILKAAIQKLALAGVDLATLDIQATPEELELLYALTPEEAVSALINATAQSVSFSNISRKSKSAQSIGMRCLNTKPPPKPRPTEAKLPADTAAFWIGS